MASTPALHRLLCLLLSLALLRPALALAVPHEAEPHPAGSPCAEGICLGFDRNDYPGDANLAALRRSFAFTGYWLGNPPGERSNSWHGKRTLLERHGFGFLLLFNGRAYAQLKSVPNPGAADASAAARAARAEGFPAGSIIFLDQEEGGRMLPEQKRYIFAWARALRRAGYLPGIYCSGIPFTEADGTRITTAQDLHNSPEGRQLTYWIANDACPPSPGCVYPRRLPAPENGGIAFAEVWQYAQSPARSQFASACMATYNRDGNCYPPQLPSELGLHLDLNLARTADPSHTRR
jgi:hypothetical protein